MNTILKLVSSPPNAETTHIPEKGSHLKDNFLIRRLDLDGTMAEARLRLLVRPNGTEEEGTGSEG